MGGAELVPTYPQDLSTSKKQREGMKVIPFLAALGPQYESAKNQLLTSVELPSLDTIFSRVSQISVEADPSDDNEEKTALSVHTQSLSTLTTGRERGCGRGGSRPIGKKEDRHYDFCQRSGHNEDKC